MFRKLLVGLVVVVVAFVAVVSMQPAHFKFERSALIDAPPEVVFAQVADFSKWAGWSPWEKLDPQAKKTHEGTPGTVGASYAWDGNDQMGAGKMTLAELKAPEFIRIRLEFLKPMAAVNDTRFTFANEAGKTRVTWTMEGENGFLSKAFGLFVNMDEMVGKSFEEGLTAMKSIGETEAKRLADAAAEAAAAEAVAREAAAKAAEEAVAAPAVP